METSKQSGQFGSLFQLLVHGLHFDVDRFLGETGLTASQVWHKGPDHDTSGMLIDLGDGTQLNFGEQTQVAIEFLGDASLDSDMIERYGTPDLACIRLHHIQNCRGMGECLNVSHLLVQRAASCGLTVEIFVEVGLPTDSPHQ